MQTLSVVIITYNEEQKIRRCLESCKEIADEIIVVDSCSTDRTKEICMEYGVRFHLHAFENYIAQKNFANGLATCNYILSLDGDEALSEELKTALTEWKKDPGVSDAYMLNRRNNYCGKWIRYSGWYPDRKIRLWKKEKGKWGGPTPHEVVELEKGSPVSHLPGDILHWSYESVEEHEERLQRYARMATLSLYRQGMRYNFFKTVYKPAARFIKHYFLKLGFLDGKYGYHIARLSAKEVYFKYAGLKQLGK